MNPFSRPSEQEVTKLALAPSNPPKEYARGSSDMLKKLLSISENTRRLLSQERPAVLASSSRTGLRSGRRSQCPCLAANSGRVNVVQAQNGDMAISMRGRKRPGTRRRWRM